MADEAAEAIIARMRAAGASKIDTIKVCAAA